MAARLSRSVVFVAFSLVATPVAAQDLTCDRGDTEVRRLLFEGNTTFRDAELEALINTTPTNWIRANPFFGPWLGRLFGSRRCLDRQDFPLDRIRLLVFYRNKGFDRATVDTVVETVGEGVADVTFRITEGVPIRIDTLVVSGMESVPGAREIRSRLRIGVGSLFDRYAIDTAQAALTSLLRNRGYPRAQVLKSFSTNAEARAARVELSVVPGQRARIGEIDVVVQSRDSATPIQISPATVRSIFGVEPGDVYSEASLVTGQRRLYDTDAYRSVRVELDSASLRSPNDSLQAIVLRLAEGEMRSATLGAGWGTLDCFRVQGGYSQFDFLGGGRRLDLTGRVSKIGVGKPLAVDVGPIKSENVCWHSSRPDEDQYGDLANYYLGATIRQPVLFGVRSLPSVTLYRELRSEYNAYRRTTPIGAVATISSSRIARSPMTFSYRVEAGRTTASPAFFCAVSLICNPEDRTRAQRLQRLAVLSGGIVHNATDDLVNPTRGSLVRLDLRHASPFVGSDDELQFNTVVGDASWYRRVGAGVLAARFRAGTAIVATSFHRRSGSTRVARTQCAGSGRTSLGQRLSWRSIPLPRTRLGPIPCSCGSTRWPGCAQFRLAVIHW
jgi:outer membrane protein insertion porin family